MSSLFKKKGSGCAAFGCSMRKGTNLLSEVKLFKFPRDSVRRKRWEIAVRRKDWKASNHSQLCNLHFVTGRPAKDPLHPDYVPSIFNFGKRTPPSLARYKRHAKRLKTVASHTGKLCSLKDKDKNRPDWAPLLNMDHRKVKNIDATGARHESSQLHTAPTDDTVLASTSRKNSIHCAHCFKHPYSVPDRKFFSFPTNEDMCKKWLIACKRPYLEKKTARQLHENFRICSAHFSKSDFANFKMNILKPTAIPTFEAESSHTDHSVMLQMKKILNPKLKNNDQSYNEEEVTGWGDMNNFDWITPINLEFEKNIVAVVFRNDQTCVSAVDIKTDEGVACLNKENETDKQKEQLMINEEIKISFPETDSSHEILQTITDCSFLCSENFPEENSPRTYSKIDKENTNIKLSKTVGCPENRTKTACSFVSSENFPKTYSKANKEINNINLKSNRNFSLKDNFTFKYLLKNLSLIKRPNVFWGISRHSNVIICARWSEDYTCRKRVVIENSLVVRVFLNEWEINLSDFMSIKCIDDICNLLQKVESSIKFHELK